MFTSLIDKKILDKNTERDTGNGYNMRLDVVGGAARSGQTRLGLKPCLPPGAHLGLFSVCLVIITARRGKDVGNANMDF